MRLLKNAATLSGRKTLILITSFHIAGRLTLLRAARLPIIRALRVVHRLLHMSLAAMIDTHNQNCPNICWFLTGAHIPLPLHSRLVDSRERFLCDAQESV